MADPRRNRRSGSPKWTNEWRGFAGALLGVVAIAVGAQVAIAMPGTPVPQSAQTLAVLLVGGMLGPVWGPISVVMYLAVGAAGLPVFSEGASGLAVLGGPTAGYLLGFVVAAGWMGRLRDSARRGPVGFSQWVLAGVVAHGMVLLLGWARLAFSLGATSAFDVGVAPFFVGGLLKSLAAAMVLAARGHRGLRRRAAGG